MLALLFLVTLLKRVEFLDVLLTKSKSQESQEQKPNIALKGETVEVVEEPTHTVANTYFHWMKNNFHSLQTQTVVINGQQYQIVTPAATMEVAANKITTL